MDSIEEPAGGKPPEGSGVLPRDGVPNETVGPETHVPAAQSKEPSVVSYEQTTDASSHYGQVYPYEDAPVATEPSVPVPAPKAAGGATGAPPKPPPPPDEEDGEEEGMLRMSFLEHLEELRSRLIRMIAGVGVAFLVSLTFSDRLFRLVSEPAVDALKQLGSKSPTLKLITPMEGFNTIWVKLPIVSAIFLSSPWILYQVWAFVSPGLYKRERRWGAPFVICSAGLFILGGVFAYFVAFRFGLRFLLSIGQGVNVEPMVSVDEYFSLFVNVMLGVGLVFELPVLIFFLTLLRIVTPKFLISHSRYAILGIVILAAIVTPTPDVVNLMLFATPMCILFYLGIFGSYLLILQREHRKFPWAKVLRITLIVLLILVGVLYLAIAKYGYRLVHQWPYLMR